MSHGARDDLHGTIDGRRELRVRGSDPIAWRRHAPLGHQPPERVAAGLRAEVQLVIPLGLRHLEHRLDESRGARLTSAEAGRRPALLADVLRLEATRTVHQEEPAASTRQNVEMTRPTRFILRSRAGTGPAPSVASCSSRQWRCRISSRMIASSSARSVSGPQRASVAQVRAVRGGLARSRRAGGGT